VNAFCFGNLEAPEPKHPNKRSLRQKTVMEGISSMAVVTMQEADLLRVLRQLDEVFELNCRAVTVWRQRQSFSTAVDLLRAAVDALSRMVVPSAALLAPIPAVVEPVPVPMPPASNPLPCFANALLFVPILGKTANNDHLATAWITAEPCDRVIGTAFPNDCRRHGTTTSVRHLISEYVNVVLFNLALIHHHAAMDPSWAQTGEPNQTFDRDKDPCPRLKRHALELYGWIEQSCMILGTAHSFPVIRTHRSEMTALVQLAVLNNIAHLCLDHHVALVQNCLLLFDFWYDAHVADDHESPWQAFGPTILYVHRQAGYASAAA
jgi:hypothetical protein